MIKGLAVETQKSQLGILLWRRWENQNSAEGTCVIALPGLSFLLCKMETRLFSCPPFFPHITWKKVSLTVLIKKLRPEEGLRVQMGYRRVTGVP